MAPVAPLPQDKHWQIGFCRHELQAPASHHRDFACLRNDRAGRAVAHSVLDNRQQGLLVLRFDVDDLCCRQAGLLDARSVEIVAAASPEDWGTGRDRFTCCDAGQEDCSGRVVDERAGCSRDFMKRASAQSFSCKPPVEGIYTERQAAMRGHRLRQGP